jgi:hypothetical protein
MKCPNCKINHPYKSGLICRCGYEFALDPKREGYADARILALVRQASGDGAHYYTKNQLATAASSKQGATIPMIITGIVLISVALVLFVFYRDVSMIGFFLMVAGCVLLAKGIANRSFDKQKFLAAISKYESKKGALPKLLRPVDALKAPPPEWNEDDLYDYGVESILIVDRNIVVDQLVLNGHHAANRMLVVSEEGYPSYIVPHVKRILAEQPTIPVRVLHGVSRLGETMAERVKRSEKFCLQNHDILDLGLSCDQLARLPELQRHAVNGEVPIDHLPWARLSAGLTSALVAEHMLVDVIGRDPDASIMSFG